MRRLPPTRAGGVGTEPANVGSAWYFLSSGPNHLLLKLYIPIILKFTHFLKGTEILQLCVLFRKSASMLVLILAHSARSACDHTSLMSLGSPGEESHLGRISFTALSSFSNIFFYILNWKLGEGGAVSVLSLYISSLSNTLAIAL